MFSYKQENTHLDGYQSNLISCVSQALLVQDNSGGCSWHVWSLGAAQRETRIMYDHLLLTPPTHTATCTTPVSTASHTPRYTWYSITIRSTRSMWSATGNPCVHSELCRSNVNCRESICNMHRCAQMFHHSDASTTENIVHINSNHGTSIKKLVENCKLLMLRIQFSSRNLHMLHQ